MSDDRDMKRVPVWLPQPTAEAIESVADQFSLSRSGILRDLVGQQIGEQEELSDAVEDAIDDDRLRIARKQHKQEKLRDLQEERERKASIEDRVRGYFRKRLEGDAAYHPDGMADLADGYRAEADIWIDDDDRIEQIEELIDQWLGWYDLGYWARQHSDRVDTEVNHDDVDGWFAVGEDLHTLRDDAEDVVERITDIADAQGVGWDADAVVDAVSSQWSVYRGSVLLLIEQLTEEDSSISEMLRLGGETIDLSGIRQQALGNGDHDIDSIEELPEDAKMLSGDADARSAMETDGGSESDDDDHDGIVTDGGEPMSQTVRELIEERLDPSAIHGITISTVVDETAYLVVFSDRTISDVSDISGEWDVLDIRTVLVDLDTDELIVTDNGIWMPTTKQHLGNVTQLLARAQQLSGNGSNEDPIRLSAAEDIDPDLLLDREIDQSPTESGQHRDRIERDPGVDPARSWGYGAGPPPELEIVKHRFEQAGIDIDDRTIRLEWGHKEPWGDRSVVPTDQLVGNYGIETLDQNDGWIGIDIDHPEHLPDEIDLPDTFAVSSPHGGDDCRHLYLKCSEKDKIEEETGLLSIDGCEWGDLWVKTRYLVGPGSQLSVFGCKNGDFNLDDKQGCDECSDQDGGYYEISNNTEIEEVSAEWVLDLIDASSGFTLNRSDNSDESDETADDAQETSQDEQDAAERFYCDECSQWRPVDGDVCAVCHAPVDPEEDAPVVKPEETGRYECEECGAIHANPHDVIDLLGQTVCSEGCSS